MNKKYSLIKRKCAICGREIHRDWYNKEELYFECVDGYMNVNLCIECSEEINKIKGE